MVSCYFVYLTSEPCGEAAFVDDVESGSPFYIPKIYLNFTTKANKSI